MESIGYDIVETARLIRRGFNRHVDELGTTGDQWRVLARLHRAGDNIRQVDLADALEVEPITLCRMIDRLEETGLVERRSDPDDRRAWRIHLTDTAAPIIADLQRLSLSFSTELYAGIDDEDLKTTRRTLDRMRDNLLAEQQRAAA